MEANYDVARLSRIYQGIDWDPRKDSPDESWKE